MLFAAAPHRSQGKRACSLFVMKAQTAALPKALHSTQTLPHVLQTGCSVLATSTNTALFHSTRLIQCDRFSMIHSVCTQSLGTGWMFREQSLERVPSAFVAAVPAARRGSSCPLADHVVSGTETLADEHMVPSPQTMTCLSCPPALTRFMSTSAVDQPGRQSQSGQSTAAPERAEPDRKHSV